MLALEPLKRISKLLETAERLGLHGVVGKRREKQARKDMVSYFRILASKTPVTTLAALANTGHKQAAQHSAEITLTRVLRGVQPLLVQILTTHKTLAYTDGYKQTVIPKIKEADDSNDIASKAADYAATSAAEAVTGISATTMDVLQTVIADAIDAQDSVDQLARNLRTSLADMSTTRAATIARTELSDAFAQAAMDKLDDYGIAYKQWISYTACCDDCSGNDDDGAIPIDDLFSSGDDAPPAHPNCRCTIAGASAP